MLWTELVKKKQFVSPVDRTLIWAHTISCFTGGGEQASAAVLLPSCHSIVSARGRQGSSQNGFDALFDAVHVQSRHPVGWHCRSAKSMSNLFCLQESHQTEARGPEWPCEKYHLDVLLSARQIVHHIPGGRCSLKRNFSLFVNEPQYRVSTERNKIS